MYYHPNTPREVVEVLESYLHASERLRLIYGESDTGRAWGKPEHDYQGAMETGYIGRSTGPQPIPLVVHNSRSLGGAAILTGSIVRIETARGRRVLYQHPKFHASPQYASAPGTETSTPEETPAEA